MPIVQGATGLENVAYIIQVDPTTRGYPAPIGAFAYSFSTNKLYVKVGEGVTGWVSIQTSASVDGVLTVTGSGVDDTDPANPVIAIVQPRAGANLTNADATKNPASDSASVYTLPAGTLSTNRILTLGTT
jgi:hypothetical protein